MAKRRSCMCGSQVSESTADLALPAVLVPSPFDPSVLPIALHNQHAVLPRPNDTSRANGKLTTDQVTSRFAGMSALATQ